MNRELDAQVAERIMGATWLYWDRRFQRRLVFDAAAWNLPEYRQGDELDRPDDLKDVPAYSTDLNACAQAEARVIGMGLGEKYAQTLEANIRADLYADDGYWTGWRAALLTASAEARCRAMLQVVGEGA